MRNIPLLLDSGAHSLYNKYIRGTGKGFLNKCYAWYYSDEFKTYVDAYAKFVKYYGEYIDYYVNVDAIGNPELTFKIHEYLEKEHGLRPMPVIHYLTDVSWIKKYMDKGYDYIAIGGLGQEVDKNNYFGWADMVFRYISDPITRLPIIKVHGLAIANFEILRRYPWYSVDASTFIKNSGYGIILVPKYVNGKWDYNSQPMRVKVTAKPHKRKILSIWVCGDWLRNVILQYIEEMGYKLGKVIWDAKNKKEIVLEEGLCSDDDLRFEFNARFFLQLCSKLHEDFKPVYFDTPNLLI